MIKKIIKKEREEKKMFESKLKRVEEKSVRPNNQDIHNITDKASEEGGRWG